MCQTHKSLTNCPPPYTKESVQITHRALLTALGGKRLPGHIVRLFEQHLVKGGRRRFIDVHVLAQPTLHALGTLWGDDFGLGGGRGGAAAGVLRALGGGRHGFALTDRAGRRRDGEQHQTRLRRHHDRLGAVGGGLRAHWDRVRRCSGVRVVVVVRAQASKSVVTNNTRSHTPNPWEIYIHYYLQYFCTREFWGGFFVAWRTTVLKYIFFHAILRV